MSTLAPAPTHRSPRVGNDPDRYIRLVKGGKYQARPYDEGVRENLGLFPTRHAARKAIAEYWWGRLKPRPRFARPVSCGQTTRWIAVVRVPARRGDRPPGWRLETVRVPGVFESAEDAHRAAVAWLARECGPLVAWVLATGRAA
jgi:hypothetical protein